MMTTITHSADIEAMSGLVSVELAALQALLQDQADARRAVSMAAYMKNQFPFLGVATPLRRSVCRPMVHECSLLQGDGLLAVVDGLWQLSEREFQYLGCDLLLANRNVSALHLPEILQLCTSKPWWDTVDILATRVVGDLVRRDRTWQAHMDTLAQHPDRWLRRVAILHQLHWRHDTDAGRLFHYCRINAGDSDFFIRKSIGWALRQYARSEPVAVRSFVAQHRAILAPLSQREALKHIGV